MPSLEEIRKLREGTASSATATPAVTATGEPSADLPTPPLGDEEPKLDDDGNPILTTEKDPQSSEVDDVIVYFNELPEVMGWDPKQFYDLKLKTDDGKELTFSEVKDTLQGLSTREASLAERIKEQERREQEFNQSVIMSQQQVQPVNQAVAEAQAAVQAIENAYTMELSNLEQYKQGSNIEGMVSSQAELTRLHSMHEQARNRLNGVMQQQQQLQQQQLYTYRAQQEQKLRSLHPEFGDVTKAEPLLTNMRVFLEQHGITPTEIRNLYDARVTSLFYQAYLWQEHQKQVKTTLDGIKGKQIRRVPAGQHPAKPDTAREATVAAINTAKTTRRESDRRLARRAIAKEAGLLG